MIKIKIGPGSLNSLALLKHLKALVSNQEELSKEQTEILKTLNTLRKNNKVSTDPRG